MDIKDHKDNNDLILELISERVGSLRELSKQGFEDVRRELNELRGLPIEVERLAGRVTQHGQRLVVLEESGTRGSEYRRGSLPIILLTLALVCSSVATVITQVH